MIEMKKLIIICLWLLFAFTSYTIPIYTNARGFWDNVWVEWTWVPWTDEDQDDSLIHTLKTGINRFIWLLATISLVLCIYAWFKMLISWGDSKQYNAWFSILKNAAIWLAIIATSRLIVSLIFWIINWSITPNI